MLQVDLREPDYKIAQYVKARCSGFGDVISVTIHRSPTPFALVLMSQRIVTQQVADQYVGAAFGNSVLIHLEQRPDAEPGGTPDTR
jgi:hypothetical protein